VICIGFLGFASLQITFTEILYNYMKIELKKFGTTLISRQNGREAFAALQTQIAALEPIPITQLGHM